MTVGILGLGLIGGSLARAYSKNGDRVYAAEKDKMISDFARMAGAIDGVLDDDSIEKCDLILLAVYTGASVSWLKEKAPLIRKDTFVIDCCGIKEDICRAGFQLAEKYGFTFVGGHPMAGSHHSGFKYSRSNLFQGAPFVIVPPRYDDILLLEKVKTLMAPCGFGFYSVTTAQEHDKAIAFTSQMPHIVSNAFIKSPTALAHKGFSAGSYKDMTRVAWLNPEMWAELFLSNRENVLSELDFYIESLKKYRDAIEASDEEQLIRLLAEGKERKEMVDG